MNVRRKSLGVMKRVMLVVAAAALLVGGLISGAEAAKPVSLEERLATLENHVLLLEGENTALKARVATLESANTALSTRVGTVETSNVMQINPYVSLDSSELNGLSGPHIIFNGVNLHLRNGSGFSATANGLGNLVLGYDEQDSSVLRTGSHNLVVGPLHTFSSVGGLVAGYKNTISGSYASVTAGRNNTASGGGSIVVGGTTNTASGSHSSVGGGGANTASGGASSVGGGSLNTATGLFSSVSGGFGHSAGAQYNWAAGLLFENQ